MSFRHFARLLLLLAIPALAYGQRTIHVPADQPTIQAGINAANAGDTVLVAPGTYKETIDFKGKAITVTSAGGAATTTIDATGISQLAVTFTNGEPRSAVLNGFTLRNGGAGGAGALGSGKGGGVYISGGQPTISNNIITGSHCGGVVSLYSSPLIQSNEIDNTLDSSVDGCGFGGDAIFLFGSFNYYNAGETATGPPAVVLGNTLQNNTLSGRDDGGGNGGAGVAVWGSNALIESNIIRNNVTLGEGAIFAMSTPLVSVIGNLVYNNAAAYTSGGIDLRPSEDSVGPFIGIVANNTVFGNTITRGQYSPQNENGSQLFMLAQLAQFVVVNNLIVGTSSYPALTCDTGYNYQGATPLAFDHNDVVNLGGGSAYSNACPDETNTYGNISADPHFVDSAAGDFHLQPGSPAIDAGNNSAPDLLPTDIAGSPRIQDGTGRGYPVVDMGAYEISGSSDAAVTTLTLTPSTYFGILYYFQPEQPFTLTAKLGAGTKIPSGPISFYMDLKLIGTVQADSSGTATLQPAVGPGLHAFLATYPGQSPFSPAVSVKFYILFPKATPILKLTSSNNPALLGASVTLTATISSTDGSIPGPIALTDGGNVLATLTPDNSGSARFTTNTLALGSHQMAASFAGNGTDNAASATLLQQVVNGLPTTTSLSCKPSTISLGATSSLLALTSSSSGSASGTLTLSDNAAPLTVIALTNVPAAYTYTGTAAGAHTLTATFAPSSNLAGSSASCTVNVIGLPSAAQLIVTPNSTTFGSPVTLSAKVSSTQTPTTSTPSGSVTFLNGSTPLGTVSLAAGLATLTIPNLPAGTDPLSCTYSGDSAFAPANCNTVSTNIAAAPTSLTLTSSANPTPVSSPPLLTIRLNANGRPVPAGTGVNLSIGQGAPLALTTDAAGTTSVAAPSLLPGSYPITATFAGTNNLLPSTAFLTETITGYPTTTSLTVTPNPAYQGQAVTLNAAVSAPSTAPALAGPITFYDGAVVLGTAPLSAGGQATLTTTSLGLGAHTLTAAFATAGVFVGSASAPLQETILPSTFAISLTPSNISIHAGQSGAAGVVLTSVGAFSGPLTLSYGALPPYASAALIPGALTLTPGGNASTTLQLKTAQDPGVATAQTSRPHTPPSSFPRSTVLGWLLAPLALFRFRRQLPRLRNALTVLALIALCHGLSGCGTVGYPFHLVPAGTYKIPVTATDANHNQRSAVLTLTVEP